MRARRLVSASLLTLTVSLLSCRGPSSTGCAPGRTGEKACLAALWTSYKQHYLDDQGFVTDPSRDGGRVTSEGQSYALLQAAWLGDRSTFARVLSWTERHLQRPDGLHSWLWDPAGSGRLVDANTATDADTDIAFALIIAAQTLDEPAYLGRASRIIRGIRTESSIPTGDAWFPSAGNWANTERIVNLSYFAPYAFEYFEQLDPGLGWARAIDVGYELLQRSSHEALLPPDFIVVSEQNQLKPLPSNSRLSREFSYDAIRIPWRIEFDCRLFQRSTACRSSVTAQIASVLVRDQGLVSRYRVDGTALTRDESLSFYGALVPALDHSNQPAAARLTKTRLSPEALETLRQARARYYDANWVWFGLALQDNFIVSQTPSRGAVRDRVGRVRG